jgi:hypothetical protein
MWAVVGRVNQRALEEGRLVSFISILSDSDRDD